MQWRNYIFNRKRASKELAFILWFVAAAFVLQADNLKISEPERRSLRVLHQTKKANSYTNDDVFWTQTNFTTKNYQLVFDGNDNFITYGQRGDPNKLRIAGVNSRIVEGLLKHFPDRFAPGQPPFQMLFSASDSPLTPCIANPERCAVDHFAPILQFGSVPKDEDILPSVIAMPMPVMCLQEKCSYDLTVPERIPWDELKPQIIWRGSDFCFSRYFKEWVREKDKHIELTDGMTRQDAINALRKAWDTLTPRWKGVSLSLMASAEEEVDGKMPWIDAKFFVRDSQPNQLVERFEELGASVSSHKYMGNKDLSAYKYHIDIGGGGGTSWQGTYEKLAMPGLLFHHETSAKDYYYDDLIPWKHYVPIAVDLSDLKEKFDWAESHPEEAQAISKCATDFVSKLKMNTNAGVVYDNYILNPLREVVDAYQAGDETLESIEEQFKIGGPLELKAFGKCDRKSCTWADVTTYYALKA